MSPSRQHSPRQACEQILLDERAYNVERSILPSETVVVDRLLARGPELLDAYEELYSKLQAHPGALQTFLGLVLSTAAFWSPEKITQARAARAELGEVNFQIAKKAAELAHLLRRRSDLHNTSGFSSDTHYHVCDVIEAAAKSNYLFTSHVQEHLRALHIRFDGKYWPTLSEFLQELASDAEAAGAEATDPLTGGLPPLRRAGRWPTSSRRCSLRSKKTANATAACYPRTSR